ncbi:MAG: hypothetical protein H0W72_04105 [Planctomycetes bacterium]|nr:hypothetical protein [Planctomycetota bacterium]
MEERLAFLARCFAMDVAGYAEMANHLHVIVRMRPEDIGAWTAEEVAQRWMSVYPRQYLPDGTPTLPAPAVVSAHAQDRVWVAERRKRLADLGWMMKALKESIAKRANREDRCTGAFWEGRFHSVPLLDQPALMACLAYVDLNPIRAKVCDRPELADCTAGYQRIQARQRHHAVQRLRAQAPPEARAVAAGAASIPGSAQPEEGLSLAPMSRCIVGEVLANRRWTIDEYLMVLDITGRILAAGKRGRIPPELAPILARLDLEVDQWVATMAGSRQMSGGAIGTAWSRSQEAVRRGVRWVKNRCPLFVADGDVAAVA